MAKQYELPDAAWDLVADIFTKNQRTGRPRADDRLMLNGISGCFALAQPGETCPNDSALGQRSINGSGDGVIAELLIRCSSVFISD